MNNHRKKCEVFGQMEIAEQVYKRGTSHKKSKGQMKTMWVTSGKVREEKPHLQPTLRKSALKNSRENMQVLQAMHQLVLIHDFAWNQEFDRRI